ncbi:MAG TPA: hypothetical protein VFJ57_08640 [Solirubrobacterales bacterium]|nr:hypothetical protein [Solirubrobacterales bacterium]
MIQAWEYMTISWVYTREWNFTPPDPGRTIWKSQFYIYRPGAGTETRLGNDSDNPEAQTTWYLEVLQEFGAEGWELVGETVIDTVLITEENGWKSKGIPAHIRWTLKRPQGVGSPTP